MESSAIMELIRNGGVMGAVYVTTIIPLSIYARNLAAELRAVQESRAKDAQQVADRLLALNDKWNATVAEQIRTVESIEKTMLDVKDALNSVRDLLMSNRR